MFKKGLRHLVLVFLSILTSMTAEAQNFTLSNNLLYDAALTPNLRLGYAPMPLTAHLVGRMASRQGLPVGHRGISQSANCVICCSRPKYAIGLIR